MPRPTEMKGQTGQINQENMEVKNEEIHYYSNAWPENGWPFHKSQAHIMFLKVLSYQLTEGVQEEMLRCKNEENLCENEENLCENGRFCQLEIFLRVV